MSTKSLEEDLAAVMSAYRALPPATERKDDSDASRASVMANTRCQFYEWEDMVICRKGGFYCIWYDGVFSNCGSN